MPTLCPRNYQHSCIGCQYLHEGRYIDYCHWETDKYLPLIVILSTKEWQDYRDAKRETITKKKARNAIENSWSDDILRERPLRILLNIRNLKGEF